MLRENDYIIAAEPTRVTNQPFQIISGQERSEALSTTMINTNLGTSNEVEYDFFVPKTASYTISGLIIAVDGTSDSFSMALNNDSFAIWHTGLSQSFAKKTWKSATLQQGKNTLKVQGRETNCKCSVWIIEDAEGRLVQPLRKSSIKDTGIVESPNFSECSITNGLVAWYPLQGDAIDYANRKDGVVTGAVPSARGYSFDGVDDKVSTQLFTQQDQALTLSGWLFSTETLNIYKNFIDSLSFRPMIWWDTNGKIEFDIDGHRTLNVYRNVWTHVLLSKPSGSAVPSYYVNGSFVGNGPSYSVGNREMTLGFRNSSGFWNGNIADVRIYNRALSAEEINILYHTTNPESPTKMKMTEDSIYIQGQFKENY
jgi:hypothetical protein